MPKLYHVFALDKWEHSPLDYVGSMLVTAETPEEAEQKAMEEFVEAFADYEIQPAAYEVTIVDGYEVSLTDTRLKIKPTKTGV